MLTMDAQNIFFIFIFIFLLNLLLINLFFFPPILFHNYIIENNIFSFFNFYYISFIRLLYDFFYMIIFNFQKNSIKFSQRFFIINYFIFYSQSSSHKKKKCAIKSYTQYEKTINTSCLEYHYT